MGGFLFKANTRRKDECVSERERERTKSERERRDWGSMSLVEGDAIFFDLPVGGVGIFFFSGRRTNSNCYADLLHFFSFFVFYF